MKMSIESEHDSICKCSPLLVCTEPIQLFCLTPPAESALGVNGLLGMVAVTFAVLLDYLLW